MVFDFIFLLRDSENDLHVLGFFNDSLAQAIFFCKLGVS